MTELSRRSALGRFLFMAGFALLFAAGPVPAQAYGTRAAVIEMVELASAAVAAHGFPGAMRHSGRKVWARPDMGLYVFVMDETGTLLLHPDKRAEGQNVIGSRDRKGTFFIRDIIEASASHPDGVWTLYMWPDPITGNLVPKRTYARRVGDVIVCAGYAGADV